MATQTMQHVGHTQRTIVRVLGTYTHDAQYDYKSMAMRVTVDGTGNAHVDYVVEGRFAGKPFTHVAIAYDVAVDKYNAIQF